MMPDAVATPNAYDWDPESSYILNVRPNETIRAAKARKVADSRLPAKSPQPWPRCGTIDGDSERIGKCFRSGTRPLPIEGDIVHLCTPHAEAILRDPDYSPTGSPEPQVMADVSPTPRADRIAFKEARGIDPTMPRAAMPSRIDRTAEYAKRDRARKAARNA